jgi:glycerol-3-phosphate O-acyltransferase / dihydroxyacetone phosphate acyltransferase
VGTVYGKDTCFTQEITPGDKIRVKGRSSEFKVKAVISDTELKLSNEENVKSEKGGEDVAYDVLPYIDQGAMFEKVLDSLAEGMNLGIFPEGGSSDRSW